MNKRNPFRNKHTIFNSDNFDVLIDDAMWGLPIGGVLMGVYYRKTKEFEIREVGVEFFQSPYFEKKEYLNECANVSLDMIQKLGVAKTDRIIVCRGFVNNCVDDLLISKGYIHTQRGIIGEPLQSYLENQAATYTKDIYGFEEYSDPKDHTDKENKNYFWRITNWVKKNNRYDIAKTGWNYWKTQRVLE